MVTAFGVVVCLLSRLLLLLLLLLQEPTRGSFPYTRAGQARGPCFNQTTHQHSATLAQLRWCVSVSAERYAMLCANGATGVSTGNGQRQAAPGKGPPRKPPETATRRQ
uniref:Putative secreted protein n=1 Tax=Anopheles darlingi TaxID=43151 RepID=A0A2M4DFL4_ANODA